EVRSAVVYATVMVALVFLPVLLLGGVEGALFRPLAIAYVLATLASLAVALTLTPALAMTLLPGAIRGGEAPAAVRALRAGYERRLGAVLRRPGLMTGLGATIMLAGIALVPFLRLEFLPEFHETNFIMHMTAAPGVGLGESARVGAVAGQRLLAVPGVASVAAGGGRAALSEDTWGAERSELMVQLTPDADTIKTTSALRERVREIGGFAFDLKQFLNERIEELLEGTGAELVVRLRGPDLLALEEGALAVAQRGPTRPRAGGGPAAGAPPPPPGRTPPPPARPPPPPPPP